MAGQLYAKLRLTADGKGFVGEIRRADKALGDMSRQERRLAAEARRANRSLGRQSELARQAGRSFFGMHQKALTYGGTLVSFTAVTRGLTAIARATIRQEQAFAQVEARIKSTGGAAGLAAQEIAAMATALQQTTTFGDEEILELQSILLSFKNITGAAFAGATEAVLNLAVAMRQDTRSAAIQLGKALDDPVSGLDGLSRSGTKFSDSLQQQIKDLYESGQVAEAQILILRELAVQYGGAASAARDTLGGALAALSNTWGDLQELGAEQSGGLAYAVNRINDALRSVDISELHRDMTSVGRVVGVVASLLIARLVVGLTAVTARSQIAAAKTRWLALQNTKLAAKTDVARARLLLGASAARRYGRAIGMASLAVRGLSRLMLLLGGPVGIAATAAYAIYEFATASDAAAGSAHDFTETLDDSAHRLQTLRNKWDELTEAERRHEINRQRSIVSQRRDALSSAEQQLADEQARRERTASRARNFGRSAGQAKRQQRQDNSDAGQAQLIALQAEVDRASRELRQAEEQKKALQSDFQSDVAGPSPAAAATKQRLADEAATTAAMSPAAQALINQFLPQKAQIKAAAEQALGQLQAERDRLEQAGGTASAIQSVDDAMARVEQDRADKLAAADQQRLADIIQLAQSLASEEDKLKVLYADQVALIERKADLADLDKEALLAQARAKYDAALATIEQRKADEQARVAAEALRAEQASGRPALDRLIASNRELAEVTDYSAEAIARRAEAVRIAADIEADYKDATDATKQALQEQLEAQAALLRQQQLRAELMDTYGGAAPQPERQEALDALVSQGQLAGLAAQAAQAEINIDAGEGGIADGYISELGRMVAETETAAAQMGQSFARVFGPGGSFSVAIADSAARAIVFGDSFKDAIGNAAREAVAALISQLIQLGIQLLITKAIGATIATTANAAQVAQVTAQVTATSALAAQNAFAATAAIPIIGPGLAPAAATAAGAAAQAIGSAAIAATAVKTVAFARGGVVEEPTFFAARGIPAGVAGEAGPEAIMPLRRLPSGRLGVESTGRPGRAVTIAPTIHVNVQGSANDPDALGQVIGQRVVAQLQPLLRAAIADEQRPGGLLNKTSVV